MCEGKQKNSQFSDSGTKLAWTGSCGYAQAGVTASMETAHRREHRYPSVFEEKRDGGAWCDKESDGEVNEKIQSNFNSMPNRYDIHMPKNYVQRSITNRKSHCQLQWEEARNGKKNTIYVSVTQNRDVPTNKTSVLRQWASFILWAGVGNWLNMKTGEWAVQHNSE